MSEFRFFWRQKNHQQLLTSELPLQANQMEKEARSGEVLLDRRSITGPITSEMPDLVLLKIVRSAGVAFESYEMNLQQRNSIILVYQGLTFPKIRVPVSKSDMPRLALYVNEKRDIVWRSSELIQSFNWLNEAPYLPTPELLESLRPSGLGNPTPSSRKRLCGCLLYRWCQTLNIRTYRDMELQAMYSSVLEAVSNPVMLRTVLYNLVPFDNSTALISVINSISRNESLKFKHSLREVNASDFESLQRRNINSFYEPLTPTEAIVAAVIVHDTDLTWSKVPLFDYYRLRRGEALSDPIIDTIARLHPACLVVTETFNPRLPIEAYSPGTLTTLARKLNIEGIGAETLYNELTLDAITNTFKIGLHPLLKTLESNLATTNFEDEIEAIPISYGSYTSKMVAYEITELTELFEHNQNFSNPGGGVFEEQAISRLKLLASREVGESNEPQQWQRLLNSIETIEQLQGSDEDECRNFLLKFRSSNPQQQALIRNVLLQLHTSALYMRSWKGDPHPWPIDSAPPDYDQDEVDRRVANSLQQMYTIIKEGNSEFGDGWNLEQLLKLPLFSHNGTGFVRNRDRDSGLTIEERLNIVYRGSNHDNSNSCIRISSNILAITAYRYLSLIGYQMPYQVRNLKSIV